MRNSINLVAGFVGLVALTSTGSAWSITPLEGENTLDPDYYLNDNHTPRIDFTDVNLFYVKNASHRKSDRKVQNMKNMRKKSYRKSGTPGLDPISNFTATSSASSTFTLNGPDFDYVSFDGYFSLSAKISESGTLESGVFSFMSSDDIFGFSTGATREVFGGTLSDLGWSESTGFIEFTIDNFTGWACDMGWCTESERLWFNVDGGSMGLTEAGHAWRATADGTAVIPVPAAVWLFGSGLVVLLGFSRRTKRVQY